MDIQVMVSSHQMSIFPMQTEDIRASLVVLPCNYCVQSVSLRIENNSTPKLKT